jgi:hypothetical protein
MITTTNELRKLSVFFFALAMSVTIGCSFFTEDTVKANAETDARKFADEFYPSWQNRRVVCQGVDFDNNQYVSCTVGGEQSRPDGTTVTRRASIECATAFMFDYGRGCRAARMVQPTNGTEE